MATRQFDYAAMQEIYSNMNKTIGSAADADSIAGVLHALDQNVQEYIGVCDEAIYGPLGDQLLLDWLNTSSNFPNFVESFNNWSQLVAMSGGDYSQFEQDVAGFKELNPLGTYSGEATTNFVDSGKYTDYTEEDIDTMSGSVLGMYAEVGDAYFVDTNMVEYEKQRKTMDMVMFGIQGLTTALSIIPAAKAIGSLTKGVGGVVKSSTTAAAKQALKAGAKGATKSSSGILATLGKLVNKKLIPRTAAAAGKGGAKGAGKKGFISSVVNLFKKPASNAGANAGKKAAEKTLKDSAKKSGSKFSNAFKSLFGKSSEATKKSVSAATKNLNKTAKEVVIKDIHYTKPDQLVSALSKKEISYKEFSKGFVEMIDCSTNPAAKANARTYLAHRIAKYPEFATAIYKGSRVTAFKTAMLELGLEGAENFSQSTLDTPTSIIHTGTVS